MPHSIEIAMLHQYYLHLGKYTYMTASKWDDWHRGVEYFPMFYIFNY